MARTRKPGEPHGNAKYLKGKIFGRLTVLYSLGSRKHGGVEWLCQCDCRNHTVALTRNLMSGNSKSCGCHKTGNHGRTTHGLSRTREHLIWRKMVHRCTKTDADNYQDYGGRGIAVCERWKDFANFFADMGQAPSLKHSLDRINNDGNYEPGNVRWATMKEQNRNQRDTVYVEYRGDRRKLIELAEEAGIAPYVLYGRVITSGWSVEKALSVPVIYRKPNHAET